MKALIFTLVALTSSPQPAPNYYAEISPEVAAEMGCTPRMAEILFHRALGHSVKDEIAVARIERAKRLLTDRKLGIGAISTMCGLMNEASLRRLFLAKVGCSMSEWRRRPFA